MVIVQKPGTTSVLQIDFGYFQKFTVDERQIIPWLDEAPLLVFTARPCEVGEYYSDEYTCKRCPKGKITYDAQTEKDKGKGCADCLENAVCYGAEIFQMEGFVRMHVDDSLFARCFNENACLEGDINEPLAKCADGYEGVMCA